MGMSITSKKDMFTYYVRVAIYEEISKGKEIESLDSSGQ